MPKIMKLRRIGNSLGLTFSKETLKAAGFDGEGRIEVELTASPGEILIKAVKARRCLELSAPELKALAAGELDTKPGQSVLAKARKLAKAEKTDKTAPADTREST